MYHKQQIFDFGADQDHVQNPVFFLTESLSLRDRYNCKTSRDQLAALVEICALRRLLV